MLMCNIQIIKKNKTKLQMLLKKTASVHINLKKCFNDLNLETIT